MHASTLIELRCTGRVIGIDPQPDDALPTPFERLKRMPQQRERYPLTPPWPPHAYQPDPPRAR